MNEINKSILDQGLRLVTEQVPGAASAALGLFVEAGSRDETPAEHGLAHLIEHMVFKGAPGRDKLTIARQIDRQGGLANAYTTKEHLCFHTRVRPEHLAEALDLLTDIFQNSLYDETELALEKGVIQQEIAMYEDEPEELVHELGAAQFWPDHPLGRPVAGTPESVAVLTGADIRRWLDREAVGPRLIVAAAGAVEHERLADLVAARLQPRPQTVPRVLTPPAASPKLTVKRRKLEQAHLVLTAPFPSAGDEGRLAASIINLALGGNMSSRLFQEIREKRGLAYSVYSSYSAYRDAGTLEIYAAAAPDKIGETRRLILDELTAARDKPLSQDELGEAVGGLITALALARDSLDSRLSRLARNEMTYGRQVDLAETKARLQAVTPDQARSLAAEYLRPERFGTCVLGPVTKAAVL